MRRGIVIGHASLGDHIAAWLDAAKRLSAQEEPNVELSDRPHHETKTETDAVAFMLRRAIDNGLADVDI